MKVEGFQFQCKGTLISFCCKQYSNKRLVIEGVYDEGSFAVLTVNLIDNKLDDGEFFVKTWSENEEFARCAMETDLFIDTGKRVKTGFVEAQVWKLANNVTFI